MALETKQGSDGFRKFSYKFKELVGLTYRDGTWVSTNEVSGYMEMVGHYVTILTMVPSYMVISQRPFYWPLFVFKIKILRVHHTLFLLRRSAGLWLNNGDIKVFI